MGFKENLKAELEYSGMLIKELSALSGVSLSTLNNYLNKRGQMPSVEMGAKIAKALGVSVEQLVSGDSEEKPDPELHMELRAVTRHYKKLKKNERTFILEMLKWINSKPGITL